MKEQDYQLLEDFLRNDLSPEDRKKVEQRLASDPDLQKAWHAMQLSQLHLQYASLTKEKQLIQEAGTSYHRPWWLSAIWLATFTGAVILIALWWPTEKKDIQNTNVTEAVKIESPKNEMEESSALTSSDSRTLAQTYKNSSTNVPPQNSQKTTDNPSIQNNTTLSPIESNRTSQEPKVASGKNCGNLLPQAEISPTCESKRDGMIRITDIKGGTAPYLFALSAEEVSTASDWHSTQEFRYLGEGNYILTVQDSQACRASIRIHVPSKYCAQEFNGLISIAQQKGWRFPLEITEGTFVVQKSSGEIVFQTDVLNGNPDGWNGSDQQGNVLPAGVYFYKLNENSALKVFGSITIVP